jgi:hypothetical protein
VNCRKRYPQLRTVCLVGGPRHETRTLAGGVSLSDLTQNACIAGRDDNGEDYLYSIVGIMQSGDLLAVEV